MSCPRMMTTRSHTVYLERSLDAHHGPYRIQQSLQDEEVARVALTCRFCVGLLVHRGVRILSWSVNA